MAAPDLGLHLRNRLGPEAGEELTDAFEEAQNDMLAITTDCVEARLIAVSAELRAEIVRTQSELRQEIAFGDAGLRVAFIEGLARIRTEMSDMRVDVLRWALLFWIGQFVATASLLAFMLHSR